MGIIFNPEVEIINESHVLSDARKVKRQISMGVLVTPDAGRNFGNEAYFKCIDASSYEKSERLTRIRFLEPQYAKKHNTPKKQDFVLKSKDVDNLFIILQQPCKKHEGETEGLPEPWLNWHELIYCFDKALNFSHQEILSISSEDKENIKYVNKRFNNFIPLDIRIPNYELLI